MDRRGLVVGLVVAAVYVETKRRSGAWSSSEFGVAAAGTLSLFGLAWMSGVAAQLFSGAANGEPTLPGVPLDEAFERVGTLAETARRITVSERSAAEPGLLVDHVELAGTATALAGRAMSASDLLREALDRLSSQPLPGPAEGQWYDVGPVGEEGRQ